MILEPKHKNFAGPSEIKETVKKRFNIRRHMSTPRAFECYYLNAKLVTQSLNPKPCGYINYVAVRLEVIYDFSGDQ